MGTTLMDEPHATGGKGTSHMDTPGGTRLEFPEGFGGREAQRSPVVGWLVIVDGPGRGHSLELGYGMNIVGRGPYNRVVLGFGDDLISEDDHFRIAYDAKHRSFHIVPGRGTNLVYVNESALLAPQPLPSPSSFTVGATSIRFVALCGPDWEWTGEEVGKE